MCLIIFKPAGRVLPEATLKDGWQQNSDGGGFAYVKGGKVVIEKGLMSLKEFLAALSKAENENKKSPFLIHFRARTVGAKDEANTHPFAITGGAFAHNGNFSNTGADYSVGLSDSGRFAERYKDDLTYDFLEKHKKGLEQVIGYNKFVILYDDGRRQIVGEKEGTWDNDVWYSNNYFRNRFMGNGGGNHRGTRLLG